MQLATLRSYTTLGIEALEVDIEVHLAPGLPGLTIVGLAETEVRESRDRVRSAITNSGFEFPARRITVNLAPADLPKHGGRFDLPIALGILIASGQVKTQALEQSVFVGELALSGKLRSIRNALAIAAKCQKMGLNLYCPKANETELEPFFDQQIWLANHLLEITAALQEQGNLTQPTKSHPVRHSIQADLAEVLGHQQAKRALEIAAAGRHNLLMSGPPGSGKSMLASRLAGILPPLSNEERLTSAIIHASEGLLYDTEQAPFRSPHHTSSAVALVGGGNLPKAGEVSLAHAGVLFLDEFAEFASASLQSLREPLENGEITLSRANYKCRLPAHFQLVAAMNPCPCGYWGSERCQCTPSNIRRYLARISGPLLDRIDLHLEVRQPDRRLLLSDKKAEPSASVKKRVVAAREMALARQGIPNAQLAASKFRQFLKTDSECDHLLREAADRLQLSARVIHRTQKVARTIADLDKSPRVTRAHLAEALTLRKSNLLQDQVEN